MYQTITHLDQAILRSMDTIISKTWAPLYTEHGDRYIQNMGTIIYRRWTPLYPERGHHYIQNMDTVISKTWTPLYTEHGHHYIQNMDTIIPKTWAPLYPEDISWTPFFFFRLFAFRPVRMSIDYTPLVVVPFLSFCDIRPPSSVHVYFFCALFKWHHYNCQLLFCALLSLCFGASIQYNTTVFDG